MLSMRGTHSGSKRFYGLLSEKSSSDKAITNLVEYGIPRHL